MASSIRRVRKKNPEKKEKYKEGHHSLPLETEVWNKWQLLPSQYELVYFPLRGRGVYIRYLLKDNNIEFKDTTVEGKNWPSVKPTTVFGQLPVFNDGDFQIAQSSAILRYLGRKHGLNGNGSAEEGVKMDMINDHLEDVRKAYTELIYRNYDEGKQAFIDGLPPKLQPLENLLTKWGSPFVLPTISWVDYNFFDLLEILQILAPGCLSSFPKLQEYFSRVASRPALKAYRETEEFKNMAINGNKNK